MQPHVSGTHGWVDVIPCIATTHHTEKRRFTLRSVQVEMHENPKRVARFCHFHMQKIKKRQTYRSDICATKQKSNTATQHTQERVKGTLFSWTSVTDLKKRVPPHRPDKLWIHYSVIPCCVFQEFPWRTCQNARLLCKYKPPQGDIPKINRPQHKAPTKMPSVLHFLAIFLENDKPSIRGHPTIQVTEVMNRRMSHPNIARRIFLQSEVGIGIQTWQICVRLPHIESHSSRFTIFDTCLKT